MPVFSAAFDEAVQLIEARTWLVDGSWQVADEGATIVAWASTWMDGDLRDSERHTVAFRLASAPEFDWTGTQVEVQHQTGRRSATLDADGSCAFFDVPSGSCHAQITKPPPQDVLATGGSPRVNGVRLLWADGYWDGPLSGAAQWRDSTYWYRVAVDPLGPPYRTYRLHAPTAEQLHSLHTRHWHGEARGITHRCYHLKDARGQRPDSRRILRVPTMAELDEGELQASPVVGWFVDPEY